MYGASSFGGTIKNIPVAPNLQETEGRIKVGYSNTADSGSGNSEFRGVINFPFVEDTLAVRVVAYHFKNSGFYKNIAASDPTVSAAAETTGAVAIDRGDVGSDKYTGGRISVLWQPTDKFTANLSYLTQKIEQDGWPQAGLELDIGSFAQRRLQMRHPPNGEDYGEPEFNEEFSDDIAIFNAALSYDFGWATLLSSSSWLQEDSKMYREIASFFGFAFAWSQPVDYASDAFIQEVRLASKFEGPFQFIAGIYYEDIEQSTENWGIWGGDLALNPFGDPKFLNNVFDDDREQKAVFGEIYYELTDQVKFIAGARAFSYDRTLTTTFEEAVFSPAGITTSMSGIPQVKWSPDSQRFVTMRIDQREVGEISLIEHAPEDGSNRPKTHTWRYAQAADGHKPTGALTVFEASDGSRTDIDYPEMELPWGAITGPDSAEIWWHDDNNGFDFVHRNPFERGYSYHSVRLDNDHIRMLFNRTTKRTSTPGLTMTNPPLAGRLQDGSFIFYSDESSWGHLYRRDGDGAVTQLTTGDWNVLDIVRVDTANGHIYYRRSQPEGDANPYYGYLYSMRLDGSDQRLVTPESISFGGMGAWLDDEAEMFSPSGQYFVDNFASMENPGTSELRGIDGNLISVLETADISGLEVEGFVPPQSFTTTAADGQTAIYGNLFFPSNFDPSKQYPIIDSIYPGPQVRRVGHDLQSAIYGSYGSPQALAELGFIVMTVDGRGTPGRSRDFIYPPGVNVLSKAGYLEDYIATIKQLAVRHTYIDRERVGIYGWSGGGYASTHAMLTYPNFFKVAVSGAGNHDQRTYIPVWGESYVGRDNGENFDATSNPHLAVNLKGKLYLVYGALDDNVHPANTMQLVEALIRANKDFDLLILPNSHHSLQEDAPYFTRRMWDYFVTHLMGATPPENYEITGLL